MSYFVNATITLLILTLVSAGWYFLFKRFEKRMSARFNDLVERSEETLKGFSDVIEVLGTIIHNLDERSQNLAERIQSVKIHAEVILHELEAADRKLDVAQGLLLVIKQDRFLEHARAMGKRYRESGQIDEAALAKLESLLAEMKLENYSRY